MQRSRRCIHPLTGWCLAAATLLALLPSTHAWLLGNENQVKWDNHCDFHGQDVVNVLATSDKCGDVCLATPTCTHWAWTAYSGGTCWLKSGTLNRVYVRSDSNCGFVVARFAVDATRGFDLGVGDSDSDLDSVAVSANRLSAADADTLLSVLNLYRLASAKPALNIDARLVLAAAELAQTCPPVLTQRAIAADLGFPVSTTVYQLAFAAPPSVPLVDAVGVWGNKTDTELSTPLLVAPTTRVGYAIRRNSQCTPTVSIARASNGSALATVYTLLLAEQV